MPIGVTNYSRIAPSRSTRARTSGDLEVMLSILNAKALNLDGSVDIERTNELRLGLARRERIPPIITIGGISYYRSIQRSPEGLLTISYEISIPIKPEAIKPDELLSLNAAATYLGVDLTKITILVREKTLRSKGPNYVYFVDLVQLLS